MHLPWDAYIYLRVYVFGALQTCTTTFISKNFTFALLINLVSQPCFYFLDEKAQIPFYFSVSKNFFFFSFCPFVYFFIGKKQFCSMHFVCTGKQWSQDHFPWRTLSQIPTGMPEKCSQIFKWQDDHRGRLFLFSSSRYVVLLWQQSLKTIIVQVQIPFLSFSFPQARMLFFLLPFNYFRGLI